MAAPEYKAGKIQLVRGVEITDNMSISFWFNITDPDLRARLDAYYQANKEDFKQQPGLEIQVKVGDTYHRVARSRLWLNDGAPAQQPAAPPYAPPPPPPPAPPPHTSVPDAPPPPSGYEAAKNG
ncbi:hypothetical protein [uncultured Limnobacter sp.]|uniref:hypothetical protein n=1 Tax=uncultured Limnobacter sp. TaxID=199681 RepID=UPI0032B2E8D4|tara:strand:- start:2024 stop:2395 length:372 start_codon:yes stop_codon:yes gene_type:complete